MQGNARCAGWQRLALPLHAADECHAEGGILAGQLRACCVVIQPGTEHQHCHLG